MALRVLLADESTTIKKVMQLALQDFAVEVKAVHAGVDVLDVARSFQPDMIFADVLLQKKNGYEVCAILKADSALKAIPVVLMWSSFMDLDDQAARNAGAEGRLEKPFDVETLRKLVLELVPKTRSQRLAHFLDFPVKANAELREEEESKHPASAPTPSAPPAPTINLGPAAPPPAPTINLGPATPPSAPPAASSAAAWSMESFEDPAAYANETSDVHHDAHHDDDDDEESFQPLELSPTLSPDPMPAFGSAPLEIEADEPSDLSLGASDDESWTHQDLSRFKLDLPPVTVDSGDGDFNIDMGGDEFTSSRMDLGKRAAAPQTFGDLRSDLQGDLNAAYGEIEEIALPESSEPSFGLETDDDELTLENPSLEAGKIPQVSAERLEEIIRAQSRDIIESAVRKIVPDLAAAIIREELERLLEDTRL